MLWTTTKALDQLRFSLAVEGADEGEKAHHVVGKLHSGIRPSQAWWRQGLETTPDFCCVQTMLMQTSWKQENIVSPSVLLMILFQALTICLRSGC